MINQRRSKYYSILKSVKNNNYDFLRRYKDGTVAFHYGTSSSYIFSDDIVDAINAWDDNYFLSIFTYNRKNKTAEQYTIEI